MLKRKVQDQIYRPAVQQKLQVELHVAEEVPTYRLVARLAHHSINLVQMRRMELLVLRAVQAVLQGPL